jgi:hypothetical protein
MAKPITTSQTIGPFPHEGWRWAFDEAGAEGGAALHASASLTRRAGCFGPRRTVERYAAKVNSGQVPAGTESKASVVDVVMIETPAAHAWPAMYPRPS